jgi:hypothetical protein
MLELAAVVLVAAIAMTFVVDAMSGMVKAGRPAQTRRGGSIRVADPDLSA